MSANEELNIIGEVKTLYHPIAVHILRNGTIVIAWYNPVAFGMISVGENLVDIDCHFKQDKSGRQFRSFDFMAVDEKRSHVIQSCTNDQSIDGFDFEGNPKFMYTGKGSPRGVALDSD